MKSARPYNKADDGHGIFCYDAINQIKTWREKVVLSDVLKVLAPTLATGLFGPLGGIVANVAAGALFPDDPTAKKTSTPSTILDALSKMTDPADLAKLNQAELDVKKFEADNNLKLADLSEQNVENARAMRVSALASGNKTADSLAWLLIWSFFAVAVLVLAGCAYLIHAGGVPSSNPNAIAGVSTLIGAIVGYFSANAQQVVGFYFGSSSGSAAKTDQMAQITQNAFNALAQPDATPTTLKGETLTGKGVSTPPKFPDDFGELNKYLPGLTVAHQKFPGSVTWSLTSAGISIDGQPAVGTLGAPTTVRNVWAWFGAEITDAAAEFMVPVELIVATICAESAGGAADKDACLTARREEPGWVSDTATPGKVSVGVMQTLISTAQSSLRNANLSADDLKQAAPSIRAGTAYIKSQYTATNTDPPLVAAAYNAGSLRLDDSTKNPWRLACYPAGTGAHVTRFVSFFNDAMKENAAGNWKLTKAAPGFAKTFNP